MFATTLTKIIDQEQFLPLDQYMSLCNHHYYTSRDPIGVHGDFITAPEISQVFGELIGAWLADLWLRNGAPTSFTLLECGPGRGTLMMDILRATRHVPGFHKAMHLRLLDTSQHLKQKQSNLLQGIDLHHITSIDDMNIDGPLLLLGNEFLDALPVRQFMYQGGHWYEQGVELSPQRRLKKSLRLADPPPLITNYPSPQDKDIIEYSPAIESFTARAANIIHTAGGAMLWIDYGHTRYAFGDTIQAVQCHRHVDILSDPGNFDLTAHINFARLSDILAHADLNLYGPVTQAHFLTKLGLHLRADQLKSRANNAQKNEIDLAIKRLIHPEEMGNLFKVLAATSLNWSPPGGFR